LRIARGSLHLGSGPGTEVHAAAFPRKRRLVLDESLREDRAELGRIAVHELFHFVWVRLSNAQRAAWGSLVAAQRAPGELGWSSELRKQALLRSGFGRASRRWSEYVCESFCDTGAWLYGGLARHDEFTLGRTERAVRKGWFAALLRHRDGRFRI
jgi:hypothetical protein